jgi:hypothetical protein
LEQINSNRLQHKDFVNISANWSPNFTNVVDISPSSIVSNKVTIDHKMFSPFMKN